MCHICRAYPKRFKLLQLYGNSEKRVKYAICILPAQKEPNYAKYMLNTIKSQFFPIFMTYTPKGFKYAIYMVPTLKGPKFAIYTLHVSYLEGPEYALQRIFFMILSLEAEK